MSSEDYLLSWSKRVPPESRLLDPLGLGNHLTIQGEFTPGITSVTDRMRYFTNLAWYWQNFSNEKDPDKRIGTKFFERTFIISCLAHHGGDSEYPGFFRVFGKSMFSKNWNEISNFELDFKISGQGKTYYNANLEKLGGAYTDDFGRIILTTVNSKLASCLSLDKKLFYDKSFTKTNLKTKFGNFCICDSDKNPTEEEIISKMFFGFVDSNKNDFDIDEKSFAEFMNKKINLDFDKDQPLLTKSMEIKQMGLKRRNTLFIFLKILHANDLQIPVKSIDLRRAMWDGIYFKQAAYDKSKIDFKKLENARRYWEYFQLNVYYVFVIEIILYVIIEIITKNPGILKNNLIKKISQKSTEKSFESLLDTKILTSDSLQKLQSVSWSKISSQESSLDDEINEATLYDYLEDSDSIEDDIAGSLVMLFFLQKRFQGTEQKIKDFKKSAKISRFIEDRLSIEYVLGKCNMQKPIFEFLEEMMVAIVNRHILEASIDFSERGTKNWIFAEEEGALYITRKKEYRIKAKDNRWSSILNLLTDAKFITIKNDLYTLTEKGRLWLSKIS